MISIGLLVKGACKKSLLKKGRIRVGVLCQYVVDKTVESPNPPFPSVRMAQLFFEFLRRYNEWKLAKRQENMRMIIVLMLGISALIIPWLFPNRGIALSIVMLILFYFSSKHYLELNKRVNHLYVNVHILHHHLIGKLEVGFCDHQEPCTCVENFRKYVFKNYKISFNTEFIR